MPDFESDMCVIKRINVNVSHNTLISTDIFTAIRADKVGKVFNNTMTVGLIIQYNLNFLCATLDFSILCQFLNS